jgi:hypothetical protein
MQLNYPTPALTIEAWLELLPYDRFSHVTYSEHLEPPSSDYPRATTCSDCATEVLPITEGNLNV